MKIESHKAAVKTVLWWQKRRGVLLTASGQNAPVMMLHSTLDYQRLGSQGLETQATGAVFDH